SQHVVMDKTGTLTKGVFRVQKAIISDSFDRSDILRWANALESHSTHPVATAIHEYVGAIDRSLPLEDVEEIAGLGMVAVAEGKQLLVGSFRLLDRFGIGYDVDTGALTDTVVAIGYDGRFAGHLIIADEIKADAGEAINQ